MPIIRENDRTYTLECDVCEDQNWTGLSRLGELRTRAKDEGYKLTRPSGARTRVVCPVCVENGERRYDVED